MKAIPRLTRLVALLGALYAGRAAAADYAAGVLADFDDGTSQDWYGMNAVAATTTAERAFGGTGFAFKILPGTFGANPAIENIDLTHCHELSLQIHGDLVDGFAELRPLLWINGSNTLQWVGPSPTGGAPAGQWVHMRIALQPYQPVSNLLLQVYGATNLFVDEIWGDALPTNRIRRVTRQHVVVETNVFVEGAACDWMAWGDASGRERVLTVVRQKDRENFWGGYVPFLRYIAGDTLRDCRSIGGGALGGFGHLVFHGTGAPGWVNSKENAERVQCAPLFVGRQHAFYRAAIDVATPNGPLVCTVDYVVRQGRNDFGYALTVESGSTTNLIADTRSPYGEFDWEGNGVYAEAISGLGWAAANRRFRTLGAPLAPTNAWDWTAPCAIPHVIEWKDAAAGDAEFGLVQTQTYDQHDAGGGYWYQYGTNGVGLPADWNCTYQLNAFQGYTTKKTTWMMPFGAVGADQYQVFDLSRGAVGTPYQSYSLLCVLDRHTTASVDAAVAEMETVHTNCSLTATLGTVVTLGPAGVGRSDLMPLSPPGWDHRYGLWTVQCDFSAIDCTLSVATNSLPAPTFCFQDYQAASPPPFIMLNETALTNGVGYYASADPRTSQLYVTFRGTFPTGANRIRFTAPATGLLLRIVRNDR